MRVSPIRRHEPRVFERPEAARAHRLPRGRRGKAARDVHKEHKPRPRKQAREHDHNDPHVPGNFRSSWVAEGGYDFVAEALFGDLNVDGFFLEYDDERSGTFEPLRFVPREKMAVLGLVTTKRGDLEDKDALKRRIEEASRFVDIDQICLSPQCGFSSNVEGNAISRGRQTDKLRLVVETAEEVWV